MILWLMSTLTINTLYIISVQFAFCCFPMTDFKDGSVCVCFRSGKVLKGVKRLEKLKKIRQKMKIGAVSICLTW